MQLDSGAPVCHGGAVEPLPPRQPLSSAAFPHWPGPAKDVCKSLSQDTRSACLKVLQLDLLSASHDLL